MSHTERSAATASPQPEPWAGKSRNAKAQARHRAKRKAYIEQLEQTVSKLQTALALSADDVANLPTAQMKLRELKDENDTLKAELRKLQIQSSTPAPLSSQSFQARLPMQMLCPASEENLRQTKKRKVSPDTMKEYVRRNLQEYLGTGDTTHNTDSRQTLHVSVASPTIPPQSRPLSQPRVQPSSVMQQSSDAVFSWRPLASYPADQTDPVSPASWSLPSQLTRPGHRQRSSSSGSSISSMSDPLYLAQAHADVQSPVSMPYKPSAVHDNGVLNESMPKTEEDYLKTDSYAYSQTSVEMPASYILTTHAIPPRNTADSETSSEQQNAWSEGAWSYSAVRTQ